MTEKIQIWLATLPWYRLPDPLFFLIASPVLHFCGIGKRWFNWPNKREGS